MTTIVLVDDHHVVRQGLRALLEAEPDFRVIGEAADGLEAASLVEELQPEAANHEPFCGVVELVVLGGRLQEALIGLRGVTVVLELELLVALLDKLGRIRRLCIGNDDRGNGEQTDTGEESLAIHG